MSERLAVIGVHSPKFLDDQDTTNHAIRVADLERGEVRPLALSGLPPPPA